VRRTVVQLRDNASAVESHLDSCASFHARWKSTPVTNAETTHSAEGPLSRMIPPISTGDPVTNFHWMFKQLRRQLACDLRGCQKYGRTGHTSLQRCSRCFVVRYCSRECQRAAWKGGAFPHKELCLLYQEIPRPDVERDAFTKACGKRGTSVDQLAVVLYHVANMWIREDPIPAHADFHIQGPSLPCIYGRCDMLMTHQDQKRALLEPAKGEVPS